MFTIAKRCMSKTKERSWIGNSGLGLSENKGMVYRKTDGLEVDCYVLLFLKVC